MRQRKSVLVIINQGLSAVWTGLLEKERERLLLCDVRWSFDWLRPMVLVTIFAGETAYAVKSKRQVEEIQELNSSIIRVPSFALSS
jgi:hypothetical protein